MATEKSSLEIEVKAKGVDKATKKIDKFGNAIDSTVKSEKALEQSSKKVSQALEKQTKVTGGALNTQERMNRSAGNMGQKAGLAAIQIEQLVGQIAGGQNPMRAFGQQSADIGFVLGKPMLGAVVGVASALGSLFIASVLSADHSLEKLQETSEALNETFIRNSSTGAYELSNSLKELSQQSKGLARMQVILFNLKVDEQLEVTTKATRKEFEKFIYVTRNFDSKIAEFDFEQIGKSANATGGEIKLLRQEFAKLMANTEDVGDNFTDLMANIFANAESDEAVKFIENMSTLLGELRKSRELANLELNIDTKSTEAGQRLIKQLQERFDLESKGFEQVIRDSKIYTQEQKEQIIQLTRNTEKIRENKKRKLEVEEINKRIANTRKSEAERKRKEEKDELTRGQETIRQLELKLIAIENGQLAADSADTKYHKSQRQIIANLKEEIRLEKVKEDAKKQALREQETQNKQNMAILEQLKKASMTQTELLKDEYLIRINAANALVEAEVISVFVANRRKLEAEQIYSAALLKMRTEAALKIEQAIAEIEARKGNSNEDKLNANQLYWTEWLKQSTEAMITFNDITGAGINTFEQGFSRAFENIIMDGQGIKGAIGGVFEAMARDQLSALGQMAAQRLQHFVVGQALEKTASATSQANIITNAATGQAAGAINAASSAAAIPLLGWKIAPLAAAAFIGATAGYLASVKSKSKGGTAGRALGGQVRGGESYIVGERGAELLTMPSNTMGRITPNSSMGGGQLNVTVENYGSSNISVQKISETDVRIIAREVATQTVQREAPRVIASDISNPNGRVSKTLANNTNTQRRR